MGLPGPDPHLHIGGVLECVAWLLRGCDFYRTVSVVLKRGQLCPHPHQQGTFNNVWECFWLSQLGAGSEVGCAAGI